MMAHSTDATEDWLSILSSRHSS